MELRNTEFQVGRDTLYKKKQYEVPEQVSYAGSATKGKYGEETKQKLLDLGKIRGKAPVIKADAVEAVVSDPNQYTKDAIKTALKKAALALQQGLSKDTTDPTDATISPTTSGGGGGNKGYFSPDSLGNLSYENMPFVPQSQYKGVETDNLRYGNTFPDGAIGIGSKSTDDFSNLPQYQSSITKEEPRQTVAALPSDYKETESKAIQVLQDYKKIVAAGLDKTVGGEDAQVNVGPGNMGTFGLGTYGKPVPSGDALKEGSFSITKEKESPKTTTTTFGGAVDVAKSLADIKAKQNVPKQTVAALPSNYKATEQKAVAAAKAYKSMTDTNTVKSKQKSAGTNKTVGGQSSQANVGTGKGSFGTGTYGKGRPSDSKTTTKTTPKKATPAQKTAVKKATTVKKSTPTSSISKSKSRSQGPSTKKSSPSTKKSSPSTKKSSPSTKKSSSPSTKKSSKKSNTGSKKSARGAKKGRKGSAGCPDPNMLILMANGSQKRAGDLVVGDLIKTNHEKDLKSGEYKVEYVNVLNNRSKAKFTFDESVIICSLSHKFYVDNDWKTAEDMVIGDEVSGKKLISIESIEDGDVIHITVEDAHTYICEGLLSHNKACDMKLKHDVSLLTNTDLKQDTCDHLADVAYFVKALKEV